MKAFDYLEKVRHLKRDITLIEYELDIIVQETFSPPAIQYDAEKVFTMPKRDSLEKAIIDHIERTDRLSKQLIRLKNKYIEKMDEALKYIRLIESDEQQEVLILRYINNNKWEEILRFRGCDDIRNQYRLHERALDSLQIILDKDSP